MIQGVIGRMAQNSFVIKGWSVTLTAALLSLATAGDNRSYAWIAVGAVAVFALLDARYLAIERRYRGLYVTAAAATGTDWSLNAGAPGVRRVLRATFSWSVLLPHGVALLASLAVAVAGP
jgi:hypothetical protein